MSEGNLQTYNGCTSHMHNMYIHAHIYTQDTHKHAHAHTHTHHTQTHKNTYKDNTYKHTHTTHKHRDCGKQGLNVNPKFILRVLSTTLKLVQTESEGLAQ